MKHILNNLSEEEKNLIREQHTDKLNIITENFSKFSKYKSGDVRPLVEQEQVPKQEIKTLVNDIAKEGLKNVTPEMIAQPPFKGEMVGYYFTGVFNNVRYQWKGNGVEGFPGIRGMAEGDIISEKNTFLAKQTNQEVPDADPNGVFVGFASKNGYPTFVVYMSKDGKPKVLSF